ncbi:hypothetical protein M1N53_03730 [Thermodesulfovibrionales bacterium]|nr:hypothetical protein [Thermodesulfovibrionales bacterium]MCL0075248.1 hypothetical protein [Thermodesulfovibrionales bacterium]
MTKGATVKIRDLNEMLIGEKQHRKQSEIVSDCIRQLIIQHREEVSIEEVREITKKASKKAERSLSKEVEALREEIA